MMILSRDAILSANDLPREEVSVPEWGGSVYVRVMTGTERDQFESAHLKSPQSDFRARLVVATVCDGEGKSLFTGADLAAVGAKSGAALDRIFQAALRVNGIGSKDIDAAEKNS